MRYLPVIVAAVSTLVVGGLWYSPLLFAVPWSKGVGLDMNDPAVMAEMKKKMWMHYIFAVVAAAITASVFYILRNILGIDSAMAGVRLGLLCWAGFVAPVKFVDAMFGKRGQKVLIIEAGYHLVTFVIMAVIVCAWRPA
jgi:hypothetical protein